MQIKHNSWVALFHLLHQMHISAISKLSVVKINIFQASKPRSHSNRKRTTSHKDNIWSNISIQQLPHASVPRLLSTSPMPIHVHPEICEGYSSIWKEMSYQTKPSFWDSKYMNVNYSERKDVLMLEIISNIQSHL